MAVAEVVKIGRACLGRDRGVIVLDRPEGEEEVDFSGCLPPADLPARATLSPTPAEDPQLAENLRRYGLEDEKRKKVAGAFWRSVRDRITSRIPPSGDLYIPGKPRQSLDYGF